MNKVKITGAPKKQHFSSLERGDLFQLIDMRTGQPCASIYIRMDEYRNALSLSSGCVASIKSAREVLKIEAPQGVHLRPCTGDEEEL